MPTANLQGSNIGKHPNHAQKQTAQFSRLGAYFNHAQIVFWVLA